MPISIELQERIQRKYPLFSLVQDLLDGDEDTITSFDFEISRWESSSRWVENGVYVYYRGDNASIRILDLKTNEFAKIISTSKPKSLLLTPIKLLNS
jgi:hypothetical protein